MSQPIPTKPALITGDHPLIGRQFVIWRTEYRSDAWRDAAGHIQPGTVVIEQVLVTVRALHQVPVTFTEDTIIHEGLEAISEDGRVYRRRWDGPVSDTTRSAACWYAQQSPWDRFADACECYGTQHVYYSHDGEQARPMGAEVCQRHIYPQAYLPAQGCRLCAADAQRAAAAQSKRTAQLAGSYALPS